MDESFPKERRKMSTIGLGGSLTLYFFLTAFNRHAGSYFVWSFILGLNCSVFYTKLAITEVNTQEEKVC